MSARFQLYANRRQMVAGAYQIHGEIRALRGDQWDVVGIFRVTEPEWDELAEVCRFHGILVSSNVKNTAIPT